MVDDSLARLVSGVAIISEIHITHILTDNGQIGIKNPLIVAHLLSLFHKKGLSEASGCQGKPSFRICKNQRRILGCIISLVSTSELSNL